MSRTEDSCFVVFGRLGSAALDGVGDIVFSSGRVEHPDEHSASISMDALVSEPGDLGSHLAGHVTRALLDSREEVVICYDLTWSDPHKWLHKLEAAGFTVSFRPFPETGRAFGLCRGKPCHLAGINWLDPVWPMDDTFFVAGNMGCGAVENALATLGITEIFRGAIGSPEELWHMIPGMQFFACLGGDDGDNLVLRRRQWAGFRVVDGLVNASRDLGFLLYDAGAVNGCSAVDFLPSVAIPSVSEWRAIPTHWRRLV